jgi:hypothetical protein
MMRRILGVALVLAGASALAFRWTHDAGAAEAPGPSLAVLPSPAKVRPDTPARGAAAVELTLLRGECESAHLAVRAGDAALAGVRAEVRGDPGGGVTVRLLREELVQLLRPSGPDGAKGAWPDPLIPDVDAYEGEHRRAFPFAVPAHETRAILVRACAAADAAPGLRTASVAVDLGGTRVVPLRLRVSPVVIPATSSLPTSFGLASRTAALGHLGHAAAEPDELLRFDHLYREALLAHRLSAHGGTWDPPEFHRAGEKVEVDFRAYDRELLPFLEGKALPGGARMTSVELRTHPGLKGDAERVAYWKAQADHLAKKGFPGVLFAYEKDEPRLGDLPEIARHARLVRSADRRIQVLVTASLSPLLEGLVDIWTPNLNCLFVRESPGEFCPWRANPEAYRQVRASGAALWWYQSCSSHGCDDKPPTPYFQGWPSYVVDAAGGRARAMGWLAFAWGIQGELYWATTYAYAKGEAPADPWAPGGLWAFGGNGDGTLLYPGTPARIGGKTHVPVESLRLELIRDGLEDFELLRLVAARPGGRELALAEARKIAPTPYDITADPAAFDAARGRLLAFLSRHGPE